MQHLSSCSCHIKGEHLLFQHFFPFGGRELLKLETLLVYEDDSQIKIGFPHLRGQRQH